MRADRLTRMSQKLLSLTKMDAGKAEERKTEDICETVEKVLRMLAPVAELHRITLVNQTLPGANIRMIEGDLHQIIFNLVENGIKYNRPDGSLTVDLRRKKDRYVLTVTDTGVGIPEESIPYIFDRFYRVDKARSRQAGGSGLGLSMSMAWCGATAVQFPPSRWNPAGRASRWSCRRTAGRENHEKNPIPCPAAGGAAAAGLPGNAAGYGQPGAVLLQSRPGRVQRGPKRPGL